MTETPQDLVQDFQRDVPILQMVPYVQVETFPLRHTPNGGGRPSCPSRATTDHAPQTSVPQNPEVLDTHSFFPAT